MNITKIKPSAIIITLCAAAILLLSAATGAAHKKQGMLEAGIQHMLAQRVAVMEVEALIRSRQPYTKDAERRGYSEIIVDAANEHRVPHLRVARVAIAESSLNHRAVGDGGKSIGVMQVSTRWWIGTVPFIESERDLRDATKNIRAGAWILAHYAELCGDEEEAVLACWNGGEQPNEQAKAYARRVAGGSGT